MKKKRETLKIGIEIFLLIGSIFAFAYILRDFSNGPVNVVVKYSGINWKNILKLLIGILINDKNFVSALETNDLKNGVGTCIRGKDKSICQEYPLSECSSKCDGSCYQTTRENVLECKIGTCYDSNLGTCQERSPKQECESRGGRWFDDDAGNIRECQKACCIVGEDVIPLITARECNKISEVSGIKTIYRPEINNELSCLVLARTKSEGACAFSDNDEKKCRFITKGECNSINGDFYENYLCTNPSLGIGYKKQATVKCVEGEDEIYWFDSEGNRENIYDANIGKSWNDGLVLSKEDSCKLGDNNPLKNQGICGNCNRFLGSVCGKKTTDEKLKDNGKDVVCRDIRCIDSNGNKRENGENWCEYQGAIGLDKGSGGFDRAVDTPGSRHFRAVCVDGEVQKDTCADYRNEVCIEEQNKREDGNIISSAACVTNLWQLCFSYNTEIGEKKGEERRIAIEKRNDKCLKNPMCSVKKVDIADNFKFDLCVPKFPPGFDLNRNADAGELSCAFANQKCTVIYVKELSGWKIKVNKGCLEQRFAEQMNDLCMSLGDCGASVNYLGDFGLMDSNYKVYNSPKLGENYLSKIEKYSEVVNGQFAQINATAYLNAIGGIEKLRGNFDDPTPEGLFVGGAISGALGSLLLISAKLGVATPILSVTTTTASGASVALSAFGGALAGAAIGFAVTSLLIQITGVGAGLDPAITWALIGAGTLGGGLAGAALLSSSGFSSFGAGLFGGVIGLGPLGLIILVVVIIVIAIFAALGIGDTEEKVVEFQCQPWQPKLGGNDCGKCGSDGYVCSKYACQSLGQTCELINEGTNEEKCVDISPNDVSSPLIEPWKEALSQGYKYDDTSDRGFKIVGEDNDGCVKAYSNLLFGINLNEPGQCKYDIEHKNKYDDMQFEFGARNLFLTNHSMLFSVPDLTSLGINGYDPNRRADYNFYVRCIDKKGNGKNSAEYVVNLCVKPGEDKSPPIVTGRSPLSEFVKFDAISLNAGVFTNEPAECKWSLENKDYDRMENKFNCENDIQDRNSLFGWECDATFPIKEDESSFYVKCKDQPWLAGNETGRRNEMKEPYRFVVKKTKTKLNIDSIEPNDLTLSFGTKIATVELVVKTSGGIDNGKAECKLFESPMQITFRNEHKQTFNQITAGDYEFNIKCTDLAGNEAEGTARFKVELDDKPPVVTRAYDNDGSLVIVTDEDAKCSYVKNSNCGFAFVNGTIMNGEEKVHSTDFDGKTYYIKCKDNWDHKPGECSIIVRGGGL